MENFNECESESELDKICNDIKEEMSIDNAVGIYNKSIQVLFERINLEEKKRATVRHNVKWIDCKAKQLKIKCRMYEKKCL